MRVLFILVLATTFLPFQSHQLLSVDVDRVRKDLERRLVKEFDSFRVSSKNKSPSRKYESSYNENLIKLIENFLLRHMKKLIENQINNQQLENSFSNLSKKPDYGEPSDEETAEATALNEETECDPNLLMGQNFTCKSIKSTTTTTTTATIEFAPLNDTTLLTVADQNQTVDEYLLSALNDSNEYRDNFRFYKKYFVYFLALVIFLTTLCLILIVVVCISCIINCKQRARLSYFNENEFFTYYKKNAPVIASVSSFSLTNNGNNNNNNKNSSQTSQTSNEALLGDKKVDKRQEAAKLNSVTKLNNENYQSIDSDTKSTPPNSTHKLSTNRFGKQSSLTLYNQQQSSQFDNISFMPNPLINVNSAAAMHHYNQKLNGKATSFFASTSKPKIQKSNSFKILNKCQPKFMNLDGLYAANSLASKNLFHLSQKYGSIDSISSDIMIQNFATISENPNSMLHVNQGKDDLLNTLSKNLIEASKNTELKQLYRQLSNENLHNQHLNFINGIRSQRASQSQLANSNNNNNSNKLTHHQHRFNQFKLSSSNTSNSAHTNLIDDHLKQFNKLSLHNPNEIKSSLSEMNDEIDDDDDDDDEDIVLESGNLNGFARKEENLACVKVIDAMSNRIQLNKTFSNDAYDAKTTTTTTRTVNERARPSPFKLNILAKSKTPATNNLNHKTNDLRPAAVLMDPSDNLIENNDELNVSPSYLRDRYYQILREQVFPFLQRPSSNRAGFRHHHNPQQQPPLQQQPPKGASNDVLY